MLIKENYTKVVETFQYWEKGQSAGCHSYFWFFILSVCPIWLPIFFLFSMNEPELGAGIDPGMAFNPFPSSILDKTRQDLNPQPLDREPSPLTTRPDLCPLFLILYLCKLVFFDQNSCSLEIGLKKRDPKRLIMSRFFLTASPTFPTTPTTTTAKKCRPFFALFHKRKM